MVTAANTLDAFYSEEMPPIPSPRQSSIAYLEAQGVLALKPLLAHAVYVDDPDIERIKAAGCTVVHTPRLGLRLRCGRMPLERFLERDVRVLLGTGGLSAVSSLNIWDEVDAAIALHHGRVEPARIAELAHQPLFSQAETATARTIEVKAAPPPAQDDAAE